MALGATPLAVTRLVLSRVFALVALGVGGAALVLVIVAACAAWLPTRRALGIAPAEILRGS
jgi:ABC-type antimicrobial peptide transport system permease subunit